MKQNLLFFLMTLISNSVFSQNAFYDAQYLNSISISDLKTIADSSSKIHLSEQEELTVNNYKTFLEYPFNNSIESLDILLLKSAVAKYNNYLKLNMEFAEDFKVSGFIGGGTAASLIPSLLNGGFSINSEQQTKIIDGLTKYYAEEFKKAQTVTYMQVFKETLGKVGELQVLFPETYSKLNHTDPSNFPNLGSEYKSIFNKDLQTLIPHLINHIDTYDPKTNTELTKNLKWLDDYAVKKIRASEYYEEFRLSSDIGAKLINNYHPVDLFNYLDSKYYKPEILKSEKKSDKIIFLIHGLNLFQRNLLDTTKTKESQFSNVWLDLENFKKLDSKKEWLYFTGLLYQQDRDFFKMFLWTPEGTEQSIADTQLTTIKEKINSILPVLIELQSVRANVNEENIEEAFFEFMKLTLASIKSVNYKLSTESQVVQDDVNKFMRIAEYTLNIYDNARKKEYDNSILYLMKILDEYLDNNAKYTETIMKFEKYSAFMIDVVNAENSKEVEDVIKKHVAPPTSFILKREYLFTTSVTGQPGYFLSTETVNRNAGFTSGITLPLGIEFTLKSVRDRKETAGSFGLFVQVIDLGAVLNFRLGDTLSELPDQINFQQIFSPGGSLTYGFKNSPVTIGLGYQYTSQLRKITEDGNTIYPNGHRVFLRFAWDIPLLNLGRSKSMIKID